MIHIDVWQDCFVFQIGFKFLWIYLLFAFSFVSGLRLHLLYIKVFGDNFLSSVGSEDA